MDIPLKLVDQQRGPFSSPALVPNRVLDLHFVKNGAVVQLHEERIADRSLGGIVIVNTEALVFHTEDLRSESVNARVGCCGIGATPDKFNEELAIQRRKNSLALGRELAENKRISDHIVDRMAVKKALGLEIGTGSRNSLPISKVVKRTLLVDDPFGSFLGADSYALDIIRSLSKLLEFGVDDMRSLYSRLCMEFGGV